jgi:uncharacterized RmlC-like cupin family protein
MHPISRRQFPFLFASRPDVPQSWRPDTIQWQRHDADGTKYAVLHGDRSDVNGLFVYAFWMPSGAWVKAHTHTRAAHVAVMSGSLRLGFGTKMDKATTETLRAGDFFFVPAGLPHFEGCTEDCLIIGTAQGGWATKELE